MATYTLAAIAEHIGGELHGDPQGIISGAAEIDKARQGQITFLANPKYKDFLEHCKASAVIIDAKAGAQPAQDYILVPDAYFGFLQAFLLLNPQEPLLSPGIHPAAIVEESAVVGENVAIGANVYIGKNARVGNNTQILPNTVIMDRAEIGSDCLLHPLVTIREGCRVGDRTIIHSGAVIGSDGFGFAPHGGRFHKIPQLGIVVLESDVEIGANTTIDRATMGQTIVKQGTKIDNLVQIAHNVEVGEHSVIVSQAGISGSTRIGNGVMIGGQVGMVGHISIGDRAQIGAQSGVAKDIPPGEVYFGSPARPIMKTKRIEAVLNNLPELRKKLDQLQKQVEQLSREKSGQ